MTTPNGLGSRDFAHRLNAAAERKLSSCRSKSHLRKAR